MSALRRQRLDGIGFVWDALDATRQDAFRSLTMYKEREGNCLVPVRHKENGFPLGYWVVNRRQNRENLLPLQQQQLEELEFVWEVQDAAWEDGFRRLTLYKGREGHCRVPPKHVENGFGLGSWVDRQRQNLKRFSLSEKRRQRLDEIGFVWDPFDVDWEEGFRRLTLYKGREGHCRAPQSLQEDDFSLGSWVRRQRGRKDNLSALRRKRLEKLGFVWDRFEADWEEGFRYLTIFKEREGHCRVPNGHMENGFGLGAWVDKQRKNKDGLSVERQQELEKLGFVWKVRPTK